MEVPQIRNSIVDRLVSHPVRKAPLHIQYLSNADAVLPSRATDAQHFQVLSADAGELAAVLREIRPQASPKFIPLNEWEGVVESIDLEEGLFWARLRDRTDPTSPRERAAFDVTDVSENDHSLFRAGAVFRWLIGKREDLFGGQERTSRLVFRRMPVYSERDIGAAEAKAALFAAQVTIE
jgi:hypothetical protein